MKPFVVEIGVEEIPSAYLSALVRSLDAAVAAALEQSRLSPLRMASGGTPRRIAVWGTVPDQQAPEVRRLVGPPVTVAYDADGSPTPAALGFARRAGVAVDGLMQSPDGRLMAEVDAPIADAAAVLTQMLPSVLEGIATPRGMRWRAEDVRFVRPVRWLVALLGAEVLPVSAYLVAADRVTYGNRTDHAEAVRIGSAVEYPALLRAVGVELSGELRRRRIEEGAAQLAEEVGGLVERLPVVDEVADLVEWPTVFRGRFDPGFMRVPAPILETAMVHHQRYLPVRSAAGDLLPYFIGVRNGVGEDLATVVHGNERVLTARLADAQFFYDEDHRTGEEARRAKLEGMVYRRAVGSYGDKTRRLVELARRWAERLGLSEGEAAALVRAAALAKLDLVTQVVGEFPELEGVMGGVYALEAGESADVADAVRDQYQPRTAADRLPTGRVGRALSLLDRLDELCTGAAAGLNVTGSEDPFGLRRSALALGRLLVDGGFPPIAQADLVRDGLAAAGVGNEASPAAADAILQLVAGRLRGALAEAGSGDVVDAALASGADWTSLRARLQMLERFAHSGGWNEVAAAAKRVARIARGAAPVAADAAHPEPEASALARALEAAETSARRGVEAWPAAATSLVQPLGRFFDGVLVMDPDESVRSRRLGLLARVGAFLNGPLDWARVSAAPVGTPSGGPG